jgi:hypothetical protein
MWLCARYGPKEGINEVVETKCIMCAQFVFAQGVKEWQ